MIHNEAANVIEGELIDGQFRIHHQIGEGGMGTVWAAEDLQLGRMVAAKFLWSHMAADARVRQRFQREARMTARVRSAHVVQVFAQGITADDVPYLIMELLEGEDLSTHLARRGRVGLRDAALIVEHIRRGLSQAHAEGLVHRDIKPHNIFLARADGDSSRPHIKLLDFGIAKDMASLRDSLTACGEVVGSALYSSPEQLRDPQSVDRATDIWALGVAIFEMLTGRVPFPASSLAELVGLHSAGRFPEVQSLVPDLPRELNGFFERALHIDARERWGSVEELAEEFAAIIGDAPDVSDDSGPAFGVAQTLRSSPSMAAACRHTKSSIRYVGRIRWVLAALVLVLLGFVVARGWSARPLARPALPLPRAAQVEPVRSAPTKPEVLPVPDTGAIMPTARIDDLPATQAVEPAQAAKPRKASISSRRKAPPPRDDSPAIGATALDAPQPRTELPGRNHGF